MNGSMMSKRKKTVNRRAFLYGAGGIAIGLPFLEGMPERSAWAQNAQPIFTFFMCAACGVEPKKFWPSGSGELTGLLAGKSVEALAPFADNLLIVKGVDFPLTGPTGCGHAQGLAQALTAKSPTGNGGQATATGPSIDTLISEAVNKAGTSPMTLYAGNLRNGYIADRLSFDKNGQVRASVDNPYKLYTALTSVAQAGGGTTTPPPTTDPGQPPAPTMQDELLSKRKSVNDLVRKELKSLLSSPKLSAADKLRLQQHFDNIRDAEGAIMGMGMNPPTTPTPAAIAGCAMGNIDEATMKGLSSWKYDAKNPEKGGIENIVELHMQLVALAFACDHNRTGTLQWGDGTDHTIYNTPANNSLGNWNLHFISHRTQSDSAVSQNGGAETAHAEIDAIRMKTLARGLQHFKDRGLADKSVIVWTNHVAEGFHSMRNVPFILWGDGGGKLKQNALIDAKSQNGPLLNTIYAAVTGAPSGSFGGGNELAAIKKA